MRAAGVIVMALLVGCSEPTPLPCSDDVTCGDGKCVDGYCAEYDLTCTSGLRYHSSAGSLAGQCTTADVTPARDAIHELREGENAIVVTDIQDNVASSCAPPGARDVMFKLHLDAVRRLYLDTYKTSYPVMLAIYATPCEALAKASARWCNSGTACDPKTRLWSEVLQPGDYCVVAEQSELLQPAASLVIRAKLGPPVVAAAMPDDAGSSCASNETVPTCNSPSGPEATWFYMTCGGTLQFDACMVTAPDACPIFDGVLAVYGLASAPLACSSIISAPLAVQFPEPGPAWVVADSLAGSACRQIRINATPL